MVNKNIEGVDVGVLFTVYVIFCSKKGSQSLSFFLECFFLFWNKEEKKSYFCIYFSLMFGRCCSFRRTLCSSRRAISNLTHSIELNGMNKTASNSIIILLILLVALFSSVSFVKADIVATNGIQLTYAPYIVFPSNATYNYEVLTLNVSFPAFIMGNDNFSMTYNLDGNNNETIDLQEHYFSMLHQPQNKSYIDSSVTLPELSEGSHRLTVYLVCNYVTWDSSGSNYQTYFDNQTVFFTTMSTTSPNPTPSSTPIVPEFPSIIIILTILITVTLLLTILVRRKKFSSF